MIVQGEDDLVAAVDSAFDQIENILEAADVKQHSSVEPDQDPRRLMYSRDAGYLIGVQVGLWLAKGGR